MGMSIDEAKQLLSQYQKLFNSLNGDYRLSQVQASELSHSIVTVLDAIRRYQMIELDRKADMVEMLRELQTEIKHFMFDLNPHSSESDYACDYMLTVVQKRINELSGETK